jgi:hypothetical protein
MDIHAWHRRVLDLLEQRDEQLAHEGLGRMWEHLASEIFLTNAEVPAWGWANADVTSTLLDFWHSFDPRVNFVLLFERAEDVVAAHMEQLDAQEQTLAQLLDAWRKRHEVLLTFGLRYSKRCVMLDAGEALAHPAAFTELLRAKWDLPLSLPAASPAVTASTPNPVAHFLAGQLLKNNAEITALQQEIDASLAAVIATPAPQAAAAIEIDNLVTGFRHLLDRSAEQQQMRLLQEQCDRTEQLYRRTLEGYQQQHQDFAAQKREHDAQLQQARNDGDKHAKTLVVLETKLHDSVEDSELLLTQLHQAQEDLAHSLLQREALHKSSTEQHQALQKQLMQAEDAHKEQRAQAFSTLERKLEESTEENELLLSHLLHAQDELEALLLHNEKSLKVDGERYQALQAQVAQAKTQCEHLEQRNNALQAELKRAKASDEQSGVSARKLRERAEENELLLLQLHQAQDELEHHFLMNQQVQEKLDALTGRLSKMQDRYPDYIEVGTVDVVRAEESRASWHLKDVALVGTDFATLQFDTVIEHGMAGFVFQYADNAAQGFFDHRLSDSEALTLLPIGTRDQVTARSAALLALSASEWKRLNALTDFLITLLSQQPAVIRAPQGFNADEWLAGLRALKANLAQFPSVLRFDHIRLKRQQVNPDYEHLWLILENLSLGDEQYWPRFEFRLSCSNVRPGMFGKFPKLEFPQVDDQTTLGSWFAESFDDFGDKLELRFALPDSMDLGVWHKLNKQDWGVLRQLIRFLPDWLQILAGNGVQLSRPVSEWQAMAREMQRITAKHTAGSVRKPAPVAAANPPAVRRAEPGAQVVRKADSLMALLDIAPASVKPKIAARK